MKLSEVLTRNTRAPLIEHDEIVSLVKRDPAREEQNSEHELRARALVAAPALKHGDTAEDTVKQLTAHRKDRARSTKDRVRAIVEQLKRVPERIDAMFAKVDELLAVPADQLEALLAKLRAQTPGLFERLQKELSVEPIKSTTGHKVFAWAEGALSMAVLGLSMANISSAGEVAAAGVAGAIALLAADGVTYFAHWALDNYFNDSRVGRAFQDHHSTPAKIREWEFGATAFNIARVTVPALAVTLALQPGFVAATAAVVFMNALFFAQEIHKWSHTSPKDQPKLVGILQRIHLIMSRKDHAKHHLRPFGGDYAVINGAITNPILDTLKLHRGLEHVIHKLTGIEPNWWREQREAQRRAREKSAPTPVSPPAATAALNGACGG